MDTSEATKVVFSRIQTLDPANASKIMGYLFFQDHGEKEMIRLAFGPDANLHNLILKAKTHLGLPSNPTSSAPSSPSPFNPISRSRDASNSFDIPNPSSSSANPWHRSGFCTPSLSYASVVKETSDIGPGSFLSSALPYSSTDLIDDYQLQDHLAFFNDSKIDSFLDQRLAVVGSPSAYADSLLHARSYLSSGVSSGSEDASSGLGWKPCLYFARGCCKNGSSCRFLHTDSLDATAIVGNSPGKLHELEQEFLRSKAAIHQQKRATASQFMAGASFPFHKSLSFLLQQQNDVQRSAAASACMEDELHQFGRYRYEKNDFSFMGLGGTAHPSSRQIYLTFPADSAFREEDVSSYFNIYGPVQDVRIPYQQKRMFGFVTFVYAETVKIILAKGNPHFVCDSRVLVKPYKEKGKIPEKKQQQHLERGEYPLCSSPSGLDYREPLDRHFEPGARTFFETQEMFRRKHEEQAELQQAFELQGRRFMNLQLEDLKSHRYPQNLSIGSAIPSPTLSPNNQVPIVPSDGIDQQVPTEKGDNPGVAASQTGSAAGADPELQQEVNMTFSSGNVDSMGEEDKSDPKESDLPENLEQSSPLNMASLKYVYSKCPGILLGMECS